MFTFRGARLLKSIFPTFGANLAERLLRSVERGDSKDIAFVLAVLRNYEGAVSIQGVCKANVRAVPERSEVWNEIAAAIETTGVVWGEYGIAQGEIAPWKEDADPRACAFAEWLVEGLDKAIKSERKRTDEEITLRKYGYGVGKEN